jgi:hypothetical protein
MFSSVLTVYDDWATAQMQGRRSCVLGDLPLLRSGAPKRIRREQKMSDSTRRSFLKTSTLTRHQLAPAGAAPPVDGGSALSRRLFLQSSAGAAGAVAVVAGPRLAAAALSGGTNTEPARVIKPSGPPPREAVMAYIRNAERNEVTVVSGMRETTYRDPVLVKRLLDASR